MQRYAGEMPAFNREYSVESVAARFTVIIMRSSECHWPVTGWEGEDRDDLSQETCPASYQRVFGGEKRVN